MSRIIVLIPIVVILLGCEMSTPPTTPPSSGNTPQPQGHSGLFFYGDTLLEQKVLGSGAIVIAKMTSFSSEVAGDENGKYRAVLKFNLSVSEYLKGSGSTNIVAVWIGGRTYDTKKEAETRKARVLAERDAQWDDREAVIFLIETSGLDTSLDDHLKRADHFLLAFGRDFPYDDRYSLSSRENRDWMPIASASATGDDRAFLLEAPSQAAGTSGVSSTPTITLGSLKKRIVDVTAEYEGGDGSDAYKECVDRKYWSMRIARYFEEKGEESYANSTESSNLASGQPAGTSFHQRLRYGRYPDRKPKAWIEGTDAALFAVEQGEATPYDSDGDGKFTNWADAIELTETFKTKRPLPEGASTRSTYGKSGIRICFATTPSASTGRLRSPLPPTSSTRRSSRGVRRQAGLLGFGGVRQALSGGFQRRADQDFHCESTMGVREDDVDALAVGVARGQRARLHRAGRDGGCHARRVRRHDQRWNARVGRGRTALERRRPADAARPRGAADADANSYRDAHANAHSDGYAHSFACSHGDGHAVAGDDAYRHADSRSAARDAGDYEPGCRIGRQPAGRELGVERRFLLRHGSVRRVRGELQEGDGRRLARRLPRDV